MLVKKVHELKVGDSLKVKNHGLQTITKIQQCRGMNRMIYFGENHVTLLDRLDIEYLPVESIAN